MVEIQKIANQVYILADQAGNCVNLIIGKERALLFDTGIGIDDVHEAVRQITELSLLVINSHGHFDHVGGNYQFDTVYLSSEDMPLLETYTFEIYEKWIKDIPVYQNVLSFPERFATWSNTRPLDFTQFDLGDMVCQVIPLQGHSKGSIGIYIPKLKLLLSGDALTPVMCLMFQNHMSVDTQYETLKRVEQMDITHFLTSHHKQAFDKEIIGRMIACIEHSKTGRGYSYQYPYPPYTKGRLYLSSMKDEEVALVLPIETRPIKKAVDR